MQPTAPQRPVMDVTVRSRTVSAVPPAIPPAPQAQPVEAEVPAPASAPVPAPMAPASTPPALTAAVPAPVVSEAPVESEAPKIPETPETPEALGAAFAPAPEPSASIDVHEAPQYEDESEEPTVRQATDQPRGMSQPKDKPAMQPEQTEKSSKDPLPAQAEVHQQPKPKSTSNVPVGTIVVALFIMAVLAGITVMVYLQS